MSGTIFEDTVWTSDKTYIINGNIGIMDGVTLTIQAGTDVQFNGNYNFNVGGALVADGSQTQPIRFMSNQTSEVLGTSEVSTWGRIYFDDTSADAVTDAEGNYQSGNLLRWVQIEGAAQGIGCNNATPYLSHVMTDGGGASCTAGNTTVWVKGGNFTGSFTVANSPAYILQTTIHGGGLSLSDASQVLTSTVGGGITAGDGSLVQNASISGDISINGIGTVVGSTAGGTVSLGSGTAQNNTVTNGGISIGSGQVLSNTLTGGGISAGTGSIIHGNNIENSPGWGIQTSGMVDILKNRLVGNASGIQVSGGLVQGNLIANTSGVGLEIHGDTTVISNTFTGNAGSAIKIVGAGSSTGTQTDKRTDTDESAPVRLSDSSPLTISTNNFEFNTGTYDIENLVLKTTLATIPASSNWWGTTDSNLINPRIFDLLDEYNNGRVVYAPVASGPIQTAPAYVRGVTVLPDTTLGIETGMFEVGFSREMSSEYIPNFSFRSPLHNTWMVYNTSNSGLPHNTVTDIATDRDGSHWLGTYGGGVAHFDGVTWTVYNTGNSGLPNNNVSAIATDLDGSHWFGTTSGTGGNGVAHFDGTNWTVYNTTNSGLPDNYILDIVTDPDGSNWFATGYGGVAHFDGINWTVYNSNNSGLPSNYIHAITTDPDGSHWFGLYVGVAHFDGTNWMIYDAGAVYDITTDADGSHWFGTGGRGVEHFDGITWTIYNTGNSGLPNNEVHAIANDINGSHWFGTMGGGVTHFDGTNWVVYNTSNSGLPGNSVGAIAIDLGGSYWFGTGVGVGHYRIKLKYPFQNNSIWLSETRYQASYDITSLIPRGNYNITVSGAVGTDGIEIALNSAYTLTVDYAGGIGDTTPPPAPAVEACAGSAIGTLSASWSASDPQSSIDLYQYAIGTSPGGMDVINWTTTAETSFTRNGLALIAGQEIYISVKARNVGGLWSLAATPDGVVAGSGVCAASERKIYLPLVMR